jgi:heptosyltransferase III
MNIVIIRPGAIGDTLLTFPILRALHDKYASPHITFVGNAAAFPLMQANGLVDEVSDYQSPLWSELFASGGVRTPELCHLLRETDLAICWLRDPECLVERNLREAGVRRLIIAPGRPPEDERIHIVEYLARTAGLDSVEILDDVPWSVAGNTIAIHPGSGSERKCWPIERFAAVIEWLWRRQHPVLVLIGPADDERLAYLRHNLAPPSPGMLRLLVNAPLIEVARQLQQCCCYLGNDSGITHLAALLGLPTMALFGSSDPLVWRPPGRLVRVIYESDLANLPVETVVEQIERFLAER